MTPPTERHDLEAGAVAPPRRWPWFAGHWRAWIGGLAALAVTGYLLSGIFTVAADEQAVIRRFGRVAARLGPGIHYRLPWPVERVDVLKTTSVMKTGVGFDLPEGDARVVVNEFAPHQRAPRLIHARSQWRDQSSARDVDLLGHIEGAVVATSRSYRIGMRCFPVCATLESLGSSLIGATAPPL